MIAYTDIRSEGPWPEFGQLGTRTFLPLWVLQSADQLISRYGEKLRFISVELWGTAVYDDNTNVARHGFVGPTWIPDVTPPSEDDLDQIPAMRRMSRRAHEIWDDVPMCLDDQGHLNGEFHCLLTRDGITFSYADYSEDTFVAEGRIIDGAWHYEERVEFFPEMTETARASLTPETALEEVTFPAEINQDRLQSPSRIAWDEDMLIVAFDGGLFAAYNGEGE